MKKDAFFLIVGFLINVQLEATGFETVWVRDVTSQFQADKRTLDDLDLPDQLTFDLNRGLDTVTLNLKRNYDIDPNADIYVVQKLRNGRSFLARTNDLEKEAIGYYQDKDNGAYMTVRCVKISNHKCYRVINGNIRIGDYNYDLRPVETDVASGHTSKVASLIRKRYILLDEGNMEQENIVERYDTEYVSESNFKEKLNARLPLFTAKGKQNNFLSLDVTLPRYVKDLQDKSAQDKTRQLRHDYYVKIAVLIDPGVWNSYASRVHPADENKVKQTIREAFSHIMNGVNFRYKTIDDPKISISIILQQFVFFKDDHLFPHNRSRVVIANGTKYIDANHYSADIIEWIKNVGNTMLPPFDNAMLFTTLGADHDGEDSAMNCKSEDLFIMSTHSPYFDKTTPYSRNPFIFSNCSVKSFRRTLISKQCVHYKGSVYNTVEWTTFMKQQPGDVFTPTEQCRIIHGPNSFHSGVVDENICRQLKCKHPIRNSWITRYIYAARGTKCGNDMWCIEGKCVSKGSK